MTAASLFGVFVLAKIAALWGRSLPWTPWTAAACFWQDALVALAYAAIASTVRRTTARRFPSSLLYWTLALYAALNVPVMRVLSTPLTWPMLRATSGTLADSILLYANRANVLLVVAVLAAAFLFPVLVARLPARSAAGIACALLALVAVGPAAAARIDTLGLHRNVLLALATSAMPRLAARGLSQPYVARDFSPAITTDARDFSPAITADARDQLSSLHGIAAGRNVILVSLESTAAQYLRLYGGAHDVTPNLDRLAAHGIVFENAYATYPESIKGLFSILCSTYPAFDTTAEMYERAPCRSAASILASAGYATALFHSGRFRYLGMESIVRGRGFGVLEDAGDIGGNQESSFGVDEPSTVARMLAWIDALPRGSRFFLTYLPIAGHHPYDSPDAGPFPSDQEIGRYRNALHYGDRSLGTLVDGLRARGLEDRTVWIVLGDHGEAMGQHEGNYGHTFFLYEENVRVPFIVAAPGAIERTERSHTMVSLIDTAPTVLDLLGLPVPAEHQGRSALDGRARMALFFTDYSLALYGLRDGAWKFVHELDSGRSKLFDLERDPGETIDVSRDHASRVADYEHTLRDWSAAQKNAISGSAGLKSRATY